jgi:predicted histone-like DNA-binding protein
MAIPYKKVQRKNPLDRLTDGKFYPQVVNLGNHTTLRDVAHKMKERSSLTLGDIQSVLTNFVETMREILFTGQSVRIQDFGVFSLTSHAVGCDRREDCTAMAIKQVRIRFRPSTSVKPDLTTTRAGEELRFYEVQDGCVLPHVEETAGAPESENENKNGTSPSAPAAPATPPTGSGNGSSGSGDDEDESGRLGI